PLPARPPGGRGLRDPARPDRDAGGRTPRTPHPPGLGPAPRQVLHRDIMTVTATPIEALTTRRSVKFLRAPAPRPDELEQILRTAVCAPDHGALRPWRFAMIRGEAIGRLADLA